MKWIGRIVTGIVIAALMPGQGTVYAHDMWNHISRADSLAMAGKAGAAKEIISAAYALAPRNFHVLWRMAKCYTDYGDKQSNPDSALSWYEQARVFADSAISREPSEMQGYIRRSICNGKIALHRGIFSAGDYVNAARRDARTAIERYNGDDFLLGVAYYILGRIHQELSETAYIFRLPFGLGYGDSEKAVEYLARAVELQPGLIRFRLDFSRALLEEDMPAKAREQLNAIGDMQAQFPGDRQRKQRAATLLQSLEP